MKRLSGLLATLMSTLLLAFLVLLARSDGAVTTSQNIDITVTHGATSPTFTFQNDSGGTLPAGTPVSFGQAFADGDVASGTYPVIRDATTHVPLAGQQWDEIATRRENGQDGSWRHAVWAALLPTSLANGATYQVEFVPTAGTYSQNSHQALSALCSGPAAHNLKIHLTDVRNQNDTVRDSGDATFRVCGNIANVGRDAPRHVRAGNVYDEYVVSGMFAYTSGHNDPLLYAMCNIDIFTKSDGVSPGDVRWVCHVINGWENVAAGSTGNAGNPGPAGFTNDPQFISFRTEVDDGTSDVLDWSGLDATVTSASNPVVNSAANSCNFWGEPVCLFIPSSTGVNAYYTGQASRVSSTGTPVGGLTNGGLYWWWPSGTATTSGDPASSQYVSPMITPYVNEPWPMTNSQGSGSTTFSTRQPLFHWAAFQTLDATGQDNWSPIGTTTRVTRKVYPALTSAEARYWQHAGIIIPIDRSQPIPGQLGPRWSLGGGVNYEPLGAMNVTGGDGGGGRPDLGLSSEWAAKAWITQAQTDWDLARLYTLGTSWHGWSTVLDEASGRISPANNGPPTGPGGNGVGGSYAGLGPLRNQVSLDVGPSTDVADPLDFVPNACCHYSGGGQPSDGSTVGYGTSLNHMPSLNGFTYMVFGDRHFLDLMQWHAASDFLHMRVGPGDLLGQGYYRDNNAKFTDGITYHYWGLMTSCCDGRGSDWLIRDVLYCAAFGADSSPERQYCNDLVTETSNYDPLHQAFRDGPGSTAYSTSIYAGGNEPDTVSCCAFWSGFVGTGYAGGISFMGAVWLHTPMFVNWNSHLQRLVEGAFGGQLPGATVPDYYAADEAIVVNVHDGSARPAGFAGNIGQYLNGTDASDWGSFGVYMYNISAGGQWGFNGYTRLTAGDTMHMIYSGWDDNNLGASNPIDQLSGTRWYTVMNVDESGTSGYQHTYFLQCNAADHTAFPTQCPTAGGPFVGYTQGGVALPNLTQTYPVIRFQYDPGAGNGYYNPNYSLYLGTEISALTIMGYNTTHESANWQTRCNEPSDSGGCYNQAYPSWRWDPTIVVPGLPAAVSTVK